MKNFKYAFTMIEVIFVIVILGILAAVAVPKFAGVTSTANFAQGKAVVSSLRSAIISERQKGLIKGVSKYPQLLDEATTAEGQSLFDGNASISIFQYPLASKKKNGSWMKRTNNSGATIGYDFCLDSTCSGSKKVEFTYTKATGKFDCTHSNDNCKKLTQ